MDEFNKILEDIKKRDIDMLVEIENLKGELHDCVNELCLRCGRYRQEHLGVCDGCRWKKVCCGGE